VKVQIGVVGNKEVRAKSVWNTALEVGREIARSGAILVCGGLMGVMEASAKGAKEAGGTTVGIIPGYEKNEANPYIDIAIATGIGYARNAIIAATSDALIAVGGGPGTMSEIALALNLDKPVVALEDSGGVADLLAGRKIDEKTVYPVSSPRDAVRLVLNKLGRSK